MFREGLFSFFQALRSLSYQVVYNSFKIPRFLKYGDLSICARPIFEDSKSILYLLSATEFIYHVIEKPINQLTNDVLCRTTAFLS